MCQSSCARCPHEYRFVTGIRGVTALVLRKQRESTARCQPGQEGTHERMTKHHVATGWIICGANASGGQSWSALKITQPEALFVSQRESLMQWDSEGMTVEELRLPARHLRACEISDGAKRICEDQCDVTVRAKEAREARRSGTSSQPPTGSDSTSGSPLPVEDKGDWNEVNKNEGGRSKRVRWKNGLPNQNG
jgi:hypothetical protein